MKRAAIAFAGCMLALSLVAVQLEAACSGAQSPGATFAGSFTSCAKANLAQLVGGDPGKTLLDDVLGLIEGNAPTLTADLDSLALTVGLDAVECAVAAVIAVLSPKPAAGSAAMAAEAPGVAKARAWLQAHSAKAPPPHAQLPAAQHRNGLAVRL